MAHREEEQTDSTLQNLGVMFLCAVAGYGLAQYQQNRRSSNQLCYTQVTDPNSLPNMLADKAEEVIRAGGQAGVRKVGALLELIVQNATGDTQVFRQALNAAQQAQNAYSEPRTVGAAGTAGAYAAKDDNEPITVEIFDKATGTWRPAE